MKRFLVFFSLALIAVLLALTSTFTLTVSADSGNMVDNVVYISDNAVEGGKGTSAEDPLYPTILPDEELEPADVNLTQSDKNVISTTIYSRYMNTALYQAVEKLAETGGTVVICGDYELDDSEARGTSYWNVLEYHLPKTKKPVTITSKYKGVDYGEINNAKLTLSGNFYTILNGPTVWENLNLHANLASDRAICCNGNKTVFGEGLVCTSKDETNDTCWLSIAGGTRYTAFNKDVDVTIKSGRFYKFIGTTWSNSTSEIVCNCDVNLKLEGGTVSYIYGNSHNTVPNSLHKGNVNITITGGTIDSPKWTGRIVCTGSGGFSSASNTVNIKITGGTFEADCVIASRMAADANNVSGVESNNINIDLSGALDVADENLNNFVTKLPAGATVIYPAKWITDNRSVGSTPTEKFVFVGDTPSSKGASVNVEYHTPAKEGEKYSQTIEYSKNSTAFTVKCDTTTAGKATAEYYFGNWKYHTAEIDVVAVPEVSIDGVQIRINTNEQQMYGWGKYTKGEYPGVTIKECGVLALPSDMRVTDEPFDHMNTYGMYDAVADKNTTTASHKRFGALVFGEEVIRENNYNRDYSLRAYVKIEYNGNTYYRYSDVIERCFYDVARSAIAGDMEASATKEWLQKNVIDVHDNYDPTHLYNPEGSEAARQKVVDYMYKMSNIEWTPKETFIIYNEGTDNGYSIGTGSTRMYGVFYKGQKYYGIPYINKNMSQYENYLYMIDQTPIIPLDNPNLKFEEKNGISDWNNLTDAQKAAGLENAKNFPGNDCLTGLMYAWNSVLNNREDIKGLTSIGSMINLKNGTIKVGDYEFDNQYLTRTDLMIKNTIGEQKIAEAYAKLQKGDATAYTRKTDTSNARHVRIVLDVHVEHTWTITWNGFEEIIDLNDSYVNFIHQAGGATGVYIYNQNDKSLDVTQKTFRELIDEGSLPMTIPELATGNVDTPFAFVSGTNFEETLPNGMLNGRIKANKQLISVRAVFEQNGNVVKEIKDMAATTYVNLQSAEYNLSGLDLSGLNLTSGGEYTFDLYACISGMDGEEIHLVDGYEFTAK